MSPTRHPESTETHRPRRSVLSIVLAFSLLILVGAVLALLTLNTFGLVILIGTGVFVMAALHYLLWGWWLGPAIRDEEREDHDSC